ncbi:ATP-binding cassette domain-containing protein [Acinetobacter sp. CFCC 10889]|uniref:ATP-binding cassette domain-containing protein n=1 Tax=Acinetobacter sp. CFCC 10889 TaxID=1775557 RepID=UPI000DD0365A|nr:ATP-binding cassette domain-containing protein [Acinetobacter sp. CFCC 10889]
MTQQACIISQLSLEFPNQLLFKNLNFSLYPQQASALIGQNGQGKSLLMQLLQGFQSDNFQSSGQIIWNTPYAYLPQLYRLHAENIAQALGIEHLQQIFQRIEQGLASIEDYETVEDIWHLPHEWQNLLDQANLPTDLNFPIAQLSEGQKTRLALCALFQKKDHYLLLDEPSNHLDQASRLWLRQSILDHPAGVLVISHDQDLLNNMQHIYALNAHGIQHIHGNFHLYQQHVTAQTEALTQSIQQQKRQVKQVKQQQHTSLMKAQKRQNQGQRLRENSSQAKILMDFNKEQAGQSFAKLKQQHSRQISEISQRLAETQSQQIHVKSQRLQFIAPSQKTGELLRFTDFILPFGIQSPIHFALHAGEKLHLIGQNGAGKSTLLDMIHQQNFVGDDPVFVAGRSVYLDQNFSFLDPKRNAIDNLKPFNTNFSDTEWRNLLGQLRLRGDKATLEIKHLSGGEKLKVALLALSQSEQAIDLLLLDEPENHLDLDSRELLANAIADFTGAVILVSHDQAFVDQCMISQHYELT